MRFLTVLALIALLAACNTGAGTTSEQPLSTLPASTGAVASPSAAAMSCKDAFASVDLSGVTSASDLTTASEQLDTTIASCQSVGDWTLALQTAAPKIDIIDAINFLQERCANNAELGSSSLCIQIGT